MLSPEFAAWPATMMRVTGCTELLAAVTTYQREPSVSVPADA